MSIYYQNTRGLKTKTKSFYENLLNSDHSIVCLVETWLQDNISSSELFDDRFFVVRGDRNLRLTNKCDGGGVLIALSKSKFKSFTSVTSWITPTVEMACVTAISHKNVQLHIFCIYLEPNFSFTKLDLLLSNLERIVNENSDDDILIVGDFNIPNFVDIYNECSDLNSANLESLKCKLLIDFLNICNLNQLNFIRNEKDRLLDLVFSNLNLEIARCDFPLVKIDNHHPPLVADFINDTSSSSSDQFRDFKKADYSSLNSIFCNIDWLSLFDNNVDVSGCVDTFYNVLVRVINEFTPFKRIVKRHFPFWFSQKTIRLIGQKRRYHKSWKTYGNSYDYQRFSQLRSDCKTSISEDHSFYLSKCERSLVADPKKFWSYIRANRNDSSSVPSTVFWDRNASTTHQEASEIFANYFESVYTDSHFDPPPVQDFYGIRVSSLSISYDEVFYHLTQLNDDCSSGPDGIPPIVLKNCAFSLTFPLTTLFNHSLQTGIFPSAWKISYVIPIFKSGDRKLANNYRPISKNSSAAQTFDCIVAKKLRLIFEDHIAPQQHGFCKGKSTLTNLISFTENVHIAYDSKHQLDSIYTDFSKAFDILNHLVLIFKLLCSGIRGDLLRWLSSYLCDRFQIVKLNLCYSRRFKASSGVPQGSHLGPLLFVLFINDLSWILSKFAGVSMFADDLKLFRVIKDNSDVLALQNCLDSLSDYCSRFLLRLNADKCHQITFSRKVSNLFSSTYILSNSPLSKVDSIKDLGVILDSKLTFNAHIKHCHGKALRMLGFVFRVCKDFRSVSALKVVYFAHVRSHLEYCSQVWSPSKLFHIADLEKIQKKFVRFLFHKGLIPDNVPNYEQPFTFNFNYNSCLNNLHLQQLSVRRKFFDIDLVLKTFTNQIDSSSFYSFFVFPPQVRALRVVNTFQVSHSKDSSLDRCMSLFNSQRLDLITLSQTPYSRARREVLNAVNLVA